MWKFSQAVKENSKQVVESRDKQGRELLNVDRQQICLPDVSVSRRGRWWIIINIIKRETVFISTNIHHWLYEL